MRSIDAAPIVLFGSLAVVAASCGLAGSSSSSSDGFGGQGTTTVVASTSGNGGAFVGAGGSGGRSAMSSSTAVTTGGGGAGHGGSSSSGGGGSGSGGSADCTPRDGVSCCENDVTCTGTNLCCLHPDGSGLVCASKCNGGLAGVPCETAADCPGMSCCGHWHHGPPGVFDMITCKGACDAPPPDPMTNDGDYPLCDTSQSDCSAGQCTSAPSLGGAHHGYCLP